MNSSKDNRENQEDSVRRSTLQPNSELEESSRQEKTTSKRMQASELIHEQPVSTAKSGLGQSA